ncbi:hypothetical protein IBG28_17740 [Marinomonas arctica]|uniref:Uncharacterized protein n=1 Tax=Marinomonas arctica TaxID=383750 RepID=A0A7H1J4R9_9GAMM|nr:hypothetical protein [Marinomonas arctica]QNT05485.1 hypothetical protein IBG28_17740 [Marinomonas arctica]
MAYPLNNQGNTRSQRRARTQLKTTNTKFDFLTRHNKEQQGKARQGKARQGKARQGKARQGKARQGKARQGKARQVLKYRENERCKDKTKRIDKIEWWVVLDSNQ